MERVIRVEALPGHRLHVEFSDGTSGTVSIADRLFGPMFEPLRDEAKFAEVFVDEFGVVAWPNGADLAPERLYVRVRDAIAA